MKAEVLKRKMQRNIEDYGALTAAKKALYYLLKPVYEHTVCCIYGIELNKVDVQEVKRDDIKFQLIDKNDFKLIKQIEIMEEWLHGKLEAKLAKNGLCLVALDEDRVVAFNLIAFGEVYVPLIKLKKVLNDDEAWSEQITVHKDYRQQFLATELRYNIFHELKKRNTKKLYGTALKNNVGSLKLARKVGFREFSYLHYIKILGYKKRYYRETEI